VKWGRAKQVWLLSLRGSHYGVISRMERIDKEGNYK
jgi:hypothetical protein